MANFLLFTIYVSLLFRNFALSYEKINIIISGFFHAQRKRRTAK